MECKSWGLKYITIKEKKKSTLLFFKATEVTRLFIDIYPETSQVIAINFI